MQVSLRRHAAVPPDPVAADALPSERDPEFSRGEVQRRVHRDSRPNSLQLDLQRADGQALRRGRLWRGRLLLARLVPRLLEIRCVRN